MHTNDIHKVQVHSLGTERAATVVAAAKKQNLSTSSDANRYHSMLLWVLDSVYPGSPNGSCDIQLVNVVAGNSNHNKGESEQNAINIMNQIIKDLITSQACFSSETQILWF